MTTQTPNAHDASLVQRSLTALKELRAKYEALEQSRREPIAIVGIGCRLPGGVDSPEALWKLLRDKVDAVSEVPGDRWDAREYFSPDVSTPGKMHMRFGAFIGAPEQFDPYFFGISPREAAQMDPQQRLFLEVAWHALEDAGLKAADLAGSDTGVFVGANGCDYLQLQLAEPRGIDTYTLIGGANCIIPNRLSYLLDLRGPSMAFDTACSSSLVAVHQACQSLRGGEVSVALAGGLNLLLSPVVSVAHSKGLPLAPDGRCKTFDASADGYVRGEGCGVVVLKRLSDALAAGDHIWATIQGSAVNQDGLSNGLTAPNGVAQRAVIRKALENARLSGAEIGLVEAHGTGTALGDPIEVETLSEVYGASGADRAPCALGSIKTNIGHLEAGAGMAGLIKVALSLKHGGIPGNLHFKELNPHISLDGTRLYVPTELTPWPAGRRFGAVSSFGAGGTNAHVVLGAGDVSRPEVASPASTGGRERAHLLVLSARSRTALVSVAQRLISYLSEGPGRDERLEDICASAALRRTHHNHRLSIVVRSKREAVEELRMFTQDPQPPTERPSTLGRHSRAVFVLPGQGRAFQGVLQGLVQDCPAFAEVFERCSRALGVASGSPGLTGEELARLGQGELSLPVLFSMQVALAETWRAWGIEPSAVIGEGLGEIAAAHVAGALSLEDAARIVLRYGERPAEANGLIEGLAGITPKPTQIPLFSVVAGACVAGGTLDPSYWAQHPRRPTPPLKGLEQLVRADHQVFIELSPEPMLLTPVARACAGLGQSDILTLPSLRKNEDGLQVLLESVGVLHEVGLAPRLEATAPAGGRFVRLPLYPFERESFWFKERTVSAARPVATVVTEPVGATVPQPARAQAQVDWAALSERERSSRVRTLIHSEVARILKFDPARLDPRGGFFQMGMDSVMAAQLRNRLEQRLGRKYAVTMIFENPSVEALSRHLASTLAPTPVLDVKAAHSAQPARGQVRPSSPELGKDDIASLLAQELEQTISVESL